MHKSSIPKTTPKTFKLPKTTPKKTKNKTTISKKTPKSSLRFSTTTTTTPTPPSTITPPPSSETPIGTPTQTPNESTPTPSKFTHWTPAASNSIKNNQLFNSTALIAGGHEHLPEMTEFNRNTHLAYLSKYIDKTRLRPNFTGPPLYAQHRHTTHASPLWGNPNYDLRHFNAGDFFAMVSCTSIQYPKITINSLPPGGSNPITYSNGWSESTFHGVSIPVRLGTQMLGTLIKRQLLHWNHIVRHGLESLGGQSEQVVDTDGNSDEKCEQNEQTKNEQTKNEQTKKSEKHSTEMTRSEIKAAKRETPTPEGFALKSPQQLPITADNPNLKQFQQKPKKSNTTFTPIESTTTPKLFNSFTIPTEVNHLVHQPWRYDMIRIDFQSTTFVSNPFSLGVDNSIYITLPPSINNVLKARLTAPDPSRTMLAPLEYKYLEAFKGKQFVQKDKEELYEIAMEGDFVENLPWLTDTDGDSITYAIPLHFTKSRFGDVKGGKHNDEIIKEIYAFFEFLQTLPPLDNVVYKKSFISPEGDREDWSLNAWTQYPANALGQVLVGQFDQHAQYPGH